MEKIQYVGEHLWAGQLGNAFVVFGFVSALLAAFAFFFQTKEKVGNWKKIGRASYWVHVISMIGITVTLVTMLSKNMFEYHYVWKHTSTDMPFKFIFSAFWNGQEGSMLTWMFWQSLLGIIVMYTAKKWESHVMTVIAGAQGVLLTMILGIYIGDWHMGSNPFVVLLREHPDFMNLPFLANPNYLDGLDGQGLNPLLRNYWMTIHPPTLLMGYASTLIPFAFGIAGLWKREYKAWMKPAVRWGFFSIMILGLGLLMGGAWAYEALSFGGFWAWDPVENASLVPWLTLVGAAHLMLIPKNKGFSLVTTFILTILTYFLVLYASFLTKSGVLGDSSVHSFTDLGLSGLLVFYFSFFGVIGFGLLIARFKDLPKNEKEDDLWSREFWMFLGALVLFISAFQITFSTSIPVWNKLFGTNMAPPTDPISHYNGWQIPFAIIISLLVGITQFLNYRKTDFKTFFNRILVHLGASIVVTIGIGISLEIKNGLYLTMLFAGMVAVLGNIDYFVKMMKSGNKKFGSSIAHFGFGLIMVGSLISNGAKETISQNSSKFDVTSLDSTYSNHEDIVLMKGDTLEMGGYNVSYQGKTYDDIYVRYNIAFLNDKNEKQFDLKPFVQRNNKMGDVPEPGTKHFWNRDIYSFVKWGELEERDEQKRDYEDPKQHQVNVGDTMYASNAIIVFQKLFGVDDVAKKKSFELEESDLLVGANLLIYDFNTKQYKATPYFAAKGLNPVSIPVNLEDLGLRITLDNINPTDQVIQFSIAEAKNKTKEFIIVSALVFPYINVLWIGIVIMTIGTGIAIYQRIKLATS